ncbi:MAG: IS1634 family transposase [Clostridium sp.]|nr:IS1634 family transposase [Clostridium sp.]
MVTNGLPKNDFLIYNRHMTSFIRKVKTKSGAIAVQIEHKQGRKRVGITHIGSAHNEAELDVLIALAHERLHLGQLCFDFEEVPDICLEKSYSGLLWDVLGGVYQKLGFEDINDPVLKQLVLARIIEPVSKLETIRVLEELGLDAPSNTSIHRCLRRIVEDDYRHTLSNACFGQTDLKALSLVLYDVTTLYFEIQREDEYRKSGLSKERRLEPQITIGLLVDSKGFPLEIQSFEGNRAEVKTILPILVGFRERHKLENITVTADAAMLSAGNISELEQLGYHYIIGSRLSKTPYEIEEYLAEEDAQLKDGQIFESSMVVTVDGKRNRRRVVYQYRQKRATLDLANIEKTLAKAQKMVERKADIKRNRFLKIKGDSSEINDALVKEARCKAGIKGYVTDLDIPAQQVIDAYHSLFQVEKSFRMSKTDLKARPIFHHKRESIEAHLTIVFAALALARYIEGVTNMSISKFVKLLKPIRTGIISIKPGFPPTHNEAGGSTPSA